MFLILDEDNCVYVYSSPKSATLAIEALDVEVIKAAFDNEGRPYRVEWIRPNEYGKSLGLIPFAENGEYRFVLAGEPNNPAWLEMIRQAHSISNGEHPPDTLVDEYVNNLKKLNKE
jgi:hypothetical protein